MVEESSLRPPDVYPSWIIAFVLFAICCWWYTDFGGPLTEAEISRYQENLRVQHGADEAMLRKWTDFMETDQGNDFFMVNALDLSTKPRRLKGVPPNLSSEEVMQIYLEYVVSEMLMRGSHPVFAGDAVGQALDTVGVDGLMAPNQWDSGAVVRYRSRRTFMDIVTAQGMEGYHVFKQAALQKTIAYPIETNTLIGDLRFIVGALLLIITLAFNLFEFRARHKLLSLEVEDAMDTKLKLSEKGIAVTKEPMGQALVNKSDS